MGLNFRLMKLNSNFQHLNKNDLIDAYIASNKRLIFLDYEGTLQDCENQDDINPLGYTPSPRLIKLLTALTSDEKNMIFIVSGRERDILSDWFRAVPNLGLASEHGFFYKYGNKESNDIWNELFQVKDWSWKESVLKILEGFTEKTEGSFISQKEVIISWFYRDCDIYFGHVQANEINTHLQNIFEHCKIDIVHGKGYVEIKPKNVNKGYFISEIIRQQFLDKNEPDFIFSIGDDTSDEEMFKYLISVQNQLNYYKENIKVFPCTIGRKPSAAKFYFNEVHEVLEYLESLNQTHRAMRRSSKRLISSQKNSDNNIFQFRYSKSGSFTASDIAQLNAYNTFHNDKKY